MLAKLRMAIFSRGYRQLLIPLVIVAIFLLIGTAYSNSNEIVGKVNEIRDQGFSSSVKIAGSPKRTKKKGSNAFKRENATFITLARNEELEGLLSSINEVESRFNKDHHYDWVFFNDEEFTMEFRQRVSLAVSGKAKFGRIPEEHWGYPSFIDMNRAADAREFLKGIIYGQSESYRFMCRFESGFFYKQPLMDEYKYYWRVEPDVKFPCDIIEDPFRVMREKNRVYGFTLALYEIPPVVYGLWEATKEFMEKYPQYINGHNANRFVSWDQNETYNLCHFWSNFEIADLDFFRSEAYETFFQHIDEAGGFFYNRWGDAPVHTLAVSLLLDRDQLHWFKNIGYYHPPFQNCPAEPEVRRELNCDCPNILGAPRDDWFNFAYEANSCISEYMIAIGKD